MGARSVFMRAASAVALAAFLGVYAQAPALLGRAGLAPVHASLEQRRVPGDVLDSFAGMPTALWLLEAAGLDPAGAGLDAVCLAGAALAAAGVAGAGCVPLFAVLAVLWLSLLNVLPSTLRTPADGVLAEALWAAAAWAPPLPGRAGGAWRRTGAPAVLLRWVGAKHAFLTAVAGFASARLVWLEGAAAGDGSPAVASASAGARLVLDLAVAPLALAPFGGARALAAAALAARGIMDAVSGVSGVAGWPAALRLALIPPLLASTVPRAATAGPRLPAPATLAGSILCAIAALAAGAQVLALSPGRLGELATGNAAVEAAVRAVAPWVVASAVAAVVLAAATDLWHALPPAPVFADGAPPQLEQAGPTPRRPPPRRVVSPNAPPPTAAFWAAAGGLLAIVSVLAGGVDVVSVAGAAPAGCTACTSSPLLAARRLQWGVRPWWVAGGVPEPAEWGAPRPGGGGVVVEAAAPGSTACDARSGAGADGWAALRPPTQPHSWWAPFATDPPRLGLALARAARVVGDGGSRPAWLEHAGWRLLQGAPAVAAAAGLAPGAPLPCAVRAWAVAPNGGRVAVLGPTSLDDPGLADRLARAGRGPLVEPQYAPSVTPAWLTAALAAPRRLGGSAVAVLCAAAGGMSAARAAATRRRARAAKRD